MNKYFNCKVQLNLTNEEGLIKKQTEEYLIYADSYASAEFEAARIAKDYAANDCIVESITKSNIEEFVDSVTNEGKFYKCKIRTFIPNEETGKFKEVTENLLVECLDIDDALRIMKDIISNTVNDTILESISLTKISEVIDLNYGKQEK